MVLTKILSNTTVFNINNKKMFLKDHVTLKTGVMIKGINYILKQKIVISNGNIISQY